MRDPEVSEDCYIQSVKTFLFAHRQCVQRIRGFYDNVLYKSTFDIDIDIGVSVAICHRFRV